jgi:DNA-binding NarL/FixJ family response regulator
MLINANDILQQFLEVAKVGDMLLVLDYLDVNSEAIVGIHQRRLLARDLADLLSKASRRADAERKAFNKLTDREIQILTLLAAGLPFAEIAECLGIKERTVRQHVENMQVKLEAQGRAKLVAVAFDLDGLCSASAETPMHNE